MPYNISLLVAVLFCFRTVAAQTATTTTVLVPAVFPDYFAGIARIGESCDAFCIGAGGFCDVAKLNSVGTSELKEALRRTGVSIAPYETIYEHSSSGSNYPEYQSWHAGHHKVVSNIDGTSTCDSVMSCHDDDPLAYTGWQCRRFCFCNPTTTTTTTTTSTTSTTTTTTATTATTSTTILVAVTYPGLFGGIAAKGLSCEVYCDINGGACNVTKLNSAGFSELKEVVMNSGVSVDEPWSTNMPTHAASGSNYPEYQSAAYSNPGHRKVVRNIDGSSTCESVMSCHDDDPGPYTNWECRRICFCNPTTTTTTTFPAEVKSVVGANNFLSLRTNGAVYASGSNSYGQLGDGTEDNRKHQVLVMTGVRDVAAGAHHSLFLMMDGRVYGAGRNEFGQLGDHCSRTWPAASGTLECGTRDCELTEDERRRQATPIPLDFSDSRVKDVQAIAAGDGHSVFLRGDGVVYASGLNSRGQLGDGTVTSRRTPVRVAEGVRSIVAGAAHTLLLKHDGSVYSTGANGFKQLGDGTKTDRRKFVLVQTDVDRIWAGTTHSMFYKTDGTVCVTGVGHGTDCSMLSS